MRASYNRLAFWRSFYRGGILALEKGGQGTLFENVKGHPGAQVLINQFGSARRMNLALEVEVSTKLPSGFAVDGREDSARLSRQSQDAADAGGDGELFPEDRSHGAVQRSDQARQFSLLDFPILQCWPKDGGRFITLPCVMTRDPKTGKRNVGMYRMQVYDATFDGHALAAAEERGGALPGALRSATWPGTDAGPTIGSRLISWRAALVAQLAEGEPVSGKMEVAVAIGTDPALTFSAIVPAPPDVEEYHDRRIPAAASR
jgi:4-hydroxy-3-polyprenylbenzoate decarboxylase